MNPDLRIRVSKWSFKLYHPCFYKLYLAVSVAASLISQFCPWLSLWKLKFTLTSNFYTVHALCCSAIFNTPAMKKKVQQTHKMFSLSPRFIFSLHFSFSFWHLKCWCIVMAFSMWWLLTFLVFMLYCGTINNSVTSTHKQLQSDNVMCLLSVCVCGCRGGAGVFWVQEVKYAQKQHAFCLFTEMKSELYISSVWQQSQAHLIDAKHQMSSFAAAA